MFKGEGLPVQILRVKKCMVLYWPNMMVKLGPWAVGEGAKEVGGLIMKVLRALLEDFWLERAQEWWESKESHTHILAWMFQRSEWLNWIQSRWSIEFARQPTCLPQLQELSLFFFFFGNCKRQKSQEIKRNRCFQFGLVTSAHQRNQSFCVCPMNASLNFHFHGNISRDNQKVEQAGFVGHNHWSNFIFVWLRPLKIHWVGGILPVLLVESSAVLTIFWSF